MIKYKNGNLLNCTEELFFHGCNNQQIMGGGIALAIKNTFPEAVNKYFTTECEVGDVIFEKTKDSRTIANVITQDFNPDKNGCCIKYNKIKEWCFKLNRYCYDYNIKTIATCKIGTGIAGGDWGIICYYLGRYLEPDLTIYVI